jgi:thiol-disulfide isomerase/thioredoxin
VQSQGNAELEKPEPIEPTPARHYGGPSCDFDGSRLVDFQLADLSNQPVRFSQLSGRLILIDFWGTWCGHCLKAMPHLVGLQQRYGHAGLQVVGIACEQDGDHHERVANVAEVRDRYRVNYPLLLAGFGAQCPVQDKFGVKLYPTLVLLDKSGHVLWKREGPDERDLKQLEKLLKTQLASSTR